MENKDKATILEKLNRTKCEIWSRVTGYLRPVNTWNKGKQSEFKDRKTYKVLSNSKD